MQALEATLSEMRAGAERAKRERGSLEAELAALKADVGEALTSKSRLRHAALLKALCSYCAVRAGQSSYFSVLGYSRLRLPRTHKGCTAAGCSNRAGKLRRDQSIQR